VLRFYCLNALTSRAFFGAILIGEPLMKTAAMYGVCAQCAARPGSAGRDGYALLCGIVCSVCCWRRCRHARDCGGCHTMLARRSGRWCWRSDPLSVIVFLRKERSEALEAGRRNTLKARARVGSAYRRAASRPFAKGHTGPRYRRQHRDVPILAGVSADPRDTCRSSPRRALERAKPAQHDMLEDPRVIVASQRAACEVAVIKMRQRSSPDSGK